MKGLVTLGEDNLEEFCASGWTFSYQAEIQLLLLWPGTEGCKVNCCVLDFIFHGRYKTVSNMPVSAVGVV